MLLGCLGTITYLVDAAARKFHFHISWVLFFCFCYLTNTHHGMGGSTNFGDWFPNYIFIFIMAPITYVPYLSACMLTAMLPAQCGFVLPCRNAGLPTQ